MVQWFTYKAYKKARFRRMETRVARRVFKEDGLPIPGFNSDVTKQTASW